MHAYVRGEKDWIAMHMHTISKQKVHSFKIEHRNKNAVTQLCLFQQEFQKKISHHNVSMIYFL